MATDLTLWKEVVDYGTSTYLALISPESVKQGAVAAAKFVGGKAISYAWKKRTDIARDIILDELAHANITESTAGQQDEMLSLILRTQRAAIEGAARVNLRLLAAVIAGRAAGNAMYADEFMSLAATIESLRREEIEVLGNFVRYDLFAETYGMPGSHDRYSAYFDEHVRPKYGSRISEYRSILGALQRTGLVAESDVSGAFSGSSGIIMGSRRLKTFAAQVNIEGVLRREDASHMKNV